MTDGRVILVTVAWPGGNVDLGVRSEVTVADLADHVGAVLGGAPAASTAEHWSAPRPGGPPGRRSAIAAGVPLAEIGVLDGDFIVFTEVGQFAGARQFREAGQAAAGKRGNTTP